MASPTPPPLSNWFIVSSEIEVAPKTPKIVAVKAKKDENLESTMAECSFVEEKPGTNQKESGSLYRGNADLRRNEIEIKQSITGIPIPSIPYTTLHIIQGCM